MSFGLLEICMLPTAGAPVLHAVLTTCAADLGGRGVDLWHRLRRVLARCLRGTLGRAPEESWTTAGAFAGLVLHSACGITCPDPLCWRICGWMVNCSRVLSELKLGPIKSVVLYGPALHHPVRHHPAPS